MLKVRRRCFIGYSNANYALAEVRDPIRTIKRAAPLAMLSVTFVYMLVNIAYLAVVDKEEIVGSGRIVAALHFGKLWGVGAERVRVHLPVSSELIGLMVRTGGQRHCRVLDSGEHPRSVVHPWARFVSPRSSPT